MDTMGAHVPVGQAELDVSMVVYLGKLKQEESQHL